MNMKIPGDSNMLLSFINLKLRDMYSSLEDLCEDLEVDVNELKEKIDKAGLKFDEAANQLKFK